MRSILNYYILLFCYILPFLLSCSGKPEAQLEIISKKYISEVGIDERSVLYISEYESDSNMRIFRISPIFLINNLKLEITSYKKIKGVWVLYSLCQNEVIDIPNFIIEDKQIMDILEYDPLEWVALICRSTNEFLIIRNSNYRDLAELPEYESFRKKCLACPSY